MTSNLKTTTRSPEPQLEKQFSVDAYADNLMEDLFKDIDKTIDGGTRLPAEPAKPEFVSLKPIKVPQIIVPQMASTPEELEKEEEARAKAAALAQAKSQEEAPSLDRILLGAAFASLVIALSLWLATKGGIQGLVKSFSPSAPVPETIDPQAEADAKFADYIERSLLRLDQQQKSSGNRTPGSLQVPAPPSPTELPKVPVSGTSTQNLSSLMLPLNRIADLIEAQAAKPPVTLPPTQVVIIPPSPPPTVVASQAAPAPVAKAQPSPQPASASVAKAQPSPQPAPAAKAQPSPQPAPAPAAKAQPSPQPAPAPAPVAKAQPSAESAEETAKSAAKPEAETETAATVAPKPEPKPEPETMASVEQKPAVQPVILPPPPVAVPTIAVSTAPNYTHTLVGVLELGDRSAALFEINGVARRIYVGESIGASAWMLVEVSEGEAVMRRNGQVRSVFVGEQF